MKYMVEPIGAQFSKKDTEKLGEFLTQRAIDGYRFHSVFHVTQTGCFGQTQGGTYLAVFEKLD
jgi:hypothetical protein